MYAPPAVELPKTSAIVGMPALDNLSQSFERCTAGNEDFRLSRQVSAARFDQRDVGQSVLFANIERSQCLLDRVRVDRAAGSYARQSVEERRRLVFTTVWRR